MRAKNTLIIIAVVFLIIFPLITLKDAGFGGADDAVGEALAEVNPEYRPWFSAIWEPPSGEVESFFFALQAAAGAGFIGYFMGYWKAKKEFAGGGDTNQDLEITG